MENTTEKKALDDQELGDASGGAAGMAMCNCPFCGQWIKPILGKDKKHYFCPLCGMLVGGPF